MTELLRSPNEQVRCRAAEIIFRVNSQLPSDAELPFKKPEPTEQELKRNIARLKQELLERFLEEPQFRAEILEKAPWLREELVRDAEFQVKPEGNGDGPLALPDGPLD